MCDNNAFLRLLAAAQATNSTSNKTPQPKGQTDAMMWQQLMAAQAHAAQMMAYQQLQQQQGLGEIFKQLNQLTAKSSEFQ